MELAFCTGSQNLPVLAGIGVQYAELGCASVAALSDKEFDDLLNLVNKTGMKIRTANTMMKKELTLLYQDEGLTDTKAYLDLLLPRLHALGVERVVFGSGNYRMMPEGLAEEKKYALLENALTLMSKEFRPYNMKVAVEPLNKKECNIFNTAKECYRTVKKLNLDNVKLLVDLYHFQLEGEDFDDIPSYGSDLIHVHIAKPVVRTYPKEGDGYDYSPFLSRLKRMGYTGIVSVEGKCEDFTKEAPLAKAVLESLMK